MISDYTFYCHHMTINMGKVIDGRYKHRIGDRVRIIIDSYGSIGEDIYAFFGIPDKIDLPNPHVTAAIRIGSGYKPKDSNSIRNRIPIESELIVGLISENTEGKGYCSLLLDQYSHEKLKNMIMKILPSSR